MRFRVDETVKVIEAPPYLSQGGTVLGQSADGELIFVRFDAAIPIDLLYHPGIAPEAYEEIREGNLQCSFCDRAHREVKRIVQGRQGYICDECIGTCMQIIIGEKA